ncbi:MAG: VCBS repeat-containing protein [Pirellulaceae bacterium]|nr:VCBS repeat-containing protein [Pirellulaceae bacterium]
MKTTVTIISLSAILACLTVLAQESPRLAAGGSLDELFKRLDHNADGKLTRDEVSDAAAFAAADADQDGSVTSDEFRRYVASRQRPQPTPAPATAKPAPAPPPVNGRPVLKQLPESDAVRDAAGVGQLFECVHVPGITDVREGMNGFALADLNRDGRPDLIATFSPPSSYRGTKLVVLINEGSFRFTPHAITIGNASSMDDFGGAAQIPNLADFNGDGFLDILVTRSAPMLGGKVRGGLKPLGVAFLLSDGAWDRFVDVSERMGARNELGYNRQTSIGDVNGDGWLDIAIGCDNIKNALGGFPHSRLYVYRSHHAPRDEKGKKHHAERDGHFEDIGGSDLVPDFGGFYHDSAKDKAGPGISLRDLDNDGDLDLLQSYHVDVREPLLPYWPGEYRQGVFCWKNLLRETGVLRFEKITGNGLHCEARLKYNREKQLYEPASDTLAPGLPYISLADVDADGLQDVLAVGPDSDFWAPRVEHVTGRFWKNLGGFRFADRTTPAGFAPLNFGYGQWMDFFEEPEPARWKNWRPRVTFESQPGLTPKHPAKNTPYFADSVFADFDNDGWLDVVVMNRSESTMTRSMLFMGKGGGTFEVKPTTFSGLDSSGISAEASDLDGDGLLDLVFAADPDNSLGPGQTVAPERYESKVYWNTGAHGAKQNHWLHLTFTGLKDAELIGARVELTADGRKQYRWIHSNHSYKSGGALDAHFGLGKATSAEVEVTLLDGRTETFPGLASGKTYELDWARRDQNP